MKFPSRAHYGLRAMIALAQGYRRGPSSLAEIAESEDISLSYLEQLKLRDRWYVLWRGLLLLLNVCLRA